MALHLPNGPLKKLTSPKKTTTTTTKKQKQKTQKTHTKKPPKKQTNKPQNNNKKPKQPNTALGWSRYRDTNLVPTDDIATFRSVTDLYLSIHDADMACHMKMHFLSKHKYNIISHDILSPIGLITCNDEVTSLHVSRGRITRLRKLNQLTTGLGNYANILTSLLFNYYVRVDRYTFDCCCQGETCYVTVLTTP